MYKIRGRFSPNISISLMSLHKKANVLSLPSDHRQLVSDSSQSIKHGVQRLPAQLHRHRGSRVAAGRWVLHLKKHISISGRRSACTVKSSHTVEAQVGTHLQLDQAGRDGHPTD